MFKVRLYLDERQDRENDERCKTFTLIWNGLLAVSYQCARLAGVTHQMNRKIIIFQENEYFIVSIAINSVLWDTCRDTLVKSSWKKRKVGKSEVGKFLFKLERAKRS